MINLTGTTAVNPVNQRNGDFSVLHLTTETGERAMAFSRSVGFGNATHKEMHMHTEKTSFMSAVLRNGQWQLTTDPLQCAEVFGQLQGVVSAKSLIADAPSVEAAMAILDGLERRYAAQADGRLDELEPPPASGHLLLRLTY